MAITADRQLMTALASNLKRLMAEKGFSQRRLAIVSKEPLMTVNNVIHSRHLPRVDVVVRLARALGVTTDELLGLSRTKKNRRTA